MNDRWTVAINHGRMTIPAELRRRCGLHPGDRVWIEEHDGKIFITPERRDEAKSEQQETDDGGEWHASKAACAPRSGLIKWLEGGPEMSAQKRPDIERVYSVTEAKNQFSAMLEFVQEPDAVAVIESHGRTKGALISAAELETLRKLKEQERRRQAWKKVEALRKQVSARNADLSDEAADELANRFVREVFQEMHESGRLYQSSDSSQ